MAIPNSCGGFGFPFAGRIYHGASTPSKEPQQRLAHRRRPSAYEPHCWATLLPPDRFSFPSGQTVTAFAVAVPLGLFYPTLLFGLLFCALSVALSRILLGLHFLSDVVAGVSLGALLEYLAFRVPVKPGRVGHGDFEKIFEPHVLRDVKVSARAHRTWVRILGALP